VGDVQLVIFDCDGVLVDSEVISNDVLARSLTALGLPTTLAEVRRHYQGLLLAEVAAKAQTRLGDMPFKNTGSYGTNASALRPFVETSNRFRVRPRRSSASATPEWPFAWRHKASSRRPDYRSS
jgi:beta-phosphoglucomutase-like phosphatase (HAD superfamily)